jgi:hypothetical protein
MGNSDVDKLLDNSTVDLLTSQKAAPTSQITYQLIHTDTKGFLGHIENNTSSSMKEFVGHALVN